MTNVEVVSQVTGIKPLDIRNIFEEVKANKKLLDNCVRPHDFSIDASPNKPLFKKWKCSKCGGTVESQFKKAYEEGLKDSNK